MTAIHYWEVSIMSSVLAIVGVSEFTNYETFKQKITDYTARFCPQITTIVSTIGVGTNAMAETYAKEKGITFKKLEPDTKTYGPLAPLVINNDITTMSTHVVVFWDKKNKVISDLRDKVLNKRKNLMTYNYVPDPIKQETKKCPKPTL